MRGLGSTYGDYAAGYRDGWNAPRTGTRPLDWHIEGTGGNCSAFVARSHRAEYYIVASEGHRPPDAGEACTLGVWDGMDEVVSEHACRLAAVAAAERHERDSQGGEVVYNAAALDGAE